MGLDITAYERLTLVRAMSVSAFTGDAQAQDAAEQKGCTYICNPDFPAHGEGMPDGIYRHDGTRVKFGAGSYHGYNEWRDWLSRAMLGVSANEA